MLSYKFYFKTNSKIIFLTVYAHPEKKKKINTSRVKYCNLYKLAPLYKNSIFFSLFQFFYTVLNSCFITFYNHVNSWNSIIYSTSKSLNWTKCRLTRLVNFKGFTVLLLSNPDNRHAIFFSILEMKMMWLHK